MRIAVDANVLVRAVVGDDAKQAQAAAKLLKDAEVIAIPVTSLCELVWVLRRVYNFGRQDISTAIEALLEVRNVAVHRPAVDAGLAVHNVGGDFADGVIAFDGNCLGGETFVSFDKKAVSLIAKQGRQAFC